MCSSILGPHPLDARTLHSSSCDKHKCSHALPYVPSRHGKASLGWEPLKLDLLASQKFIFFSEFHGKAVNILNRRVS